MTHAERRQLEQDILRIKPYYNLSKFSDNQLLAIRSKLLDKAKMAVFVILWGLGAIFTSPSTLHAYEVPDKLLDAIYHAEGGQKAKVPYGLIYSSWCTEEPGWCRYYAREIIRVHRQRWEKAKRPGEWLSYLASKYAPVNAENDPTGLNHHWLKNIRWYLSGR